MIAYSEGAAFDHSDASYKALHSQHQCALNEQYQANPERFRKGPPKAAMPPQVVYINPVITIDKEPSETPTVNTQ